MKVEGELGSFTFAGSCVRSIELARQEACAAQGTYLFMTDVMSLLRLQMRYSKESLTLYRNEYPLLSVVRFLILNLRQCTLP